jgi:hypothetical protein
VLIAVDVGQRHLILDLLQQPGPLPDKPGGHLPAVRLPCQFRVSRDRGRHTPNRAPAPPRGFRRSPSGRGAQLALYFV